MALQHIRPADAGGALPAPRSQANDDGQLVVERESTIIGRRDVALIPWVTIAVVALAVAVSAWLRTSGGPSDSLLITGALIYAGVAGFFALLQDKPFALRMRRSLAVYLIGSLLLVGLLCVMAALDVGLATVYYAPTVQVAFYLGLVLWARWSVGAILVVLLGAVTVQLVTPDATPLQAVTMLGLIVAGWLVGVLCHVSHGRASRIALMLSVSDVLTATLNRRGFFAQFDYEIGLAAEEGKPMALLIVDLDGFKVVNDRLGHAAGDELLAWVGRTLPTVLPPQAAIGRLGGDEFGIILPGATSAEAEALAYAVRAAIGPRVDACVGVATSQDGGTVADDYLRVADAAMYQCKAEPGLQVQVLVAGSTTGASKARRDGQRPPAMTYAALRAAGGPPDRPASGTHFGWLLRGGFWVIAACGTVVVAGTALEGPNNGYGDAILIFGLPWVASLVFLGWKYFGDRLANGTALSAHMTSSIVLGIGVSLAMLAGGGITAPIVAALYLKVLFDASVLPKRQARSQAAVILIWYMVVAILSPHSELWAVPYQLTLFAVSYALGTVGRQAFMDATSQRLRLAHTDALTNLRNRPGFEQGAAKALTAATEEQLPFAVIAFDLDDFKAINDKLGHAAGDELLRNVADVTKHTLTTAYTVGRLGGDEFVAAIPAATSTAAASIGASLTHELEPIIGASVGYSVFPDDGSTLEALLRVADRRSYVAKPGRSGTVLEPLDRRSDDRRSSDGERRTENRRAQQPEKLARTSSPDEPDGAPA